MKRLILVLTLFCSTLAVAQPTTPNYLRRSGDTLITLNSFWLKAHGIKVVTAIDTTELNMERIRLSMIARGLVAASSLGSASGMDSNRVMTLDKTQQITGRKEFSIGQEMDTVYSSVSDLVKLTLNGTSASTSFGRYLNTNSQSYVHLWGERLTSGAGTQWVAGFANTQDTVTIGHAFNVRNIPIILSSSTNVAKNTWDGSARLVFQPEPANGNDSTGYCFDLQKTDRGQNGYNTFNWWASKGYDEYGRIMGSKYYLMMRVDSARTIRFHPGISTADFSYVDPRIAIGGGAADSMFSVQYGAHINRGLKVDGASMFATPPFISTTDTLATKDYARSVGGGGGDVSASDSLTVFATPTQVRGIVTDSLDWVRDSVAALRDDIGSGSGISDSSAFVLTEDSTVTYVTPTQLALKADISSLSSGAYWDTTRAVTLDKTQTITGTKTFTGILTAQNEIISQGINALLRLDDQTNSGNYYTLYHSSGYLNFYKNGDVRAWIDTVGNAHFDGDLVTIGTDTVANLQDIRDAVTVSDSSFVEIFIDSFSANGDKITLKDTLEVGGYLTVNGTPLFNASAQPLFIVDTLALDVDGVYEAMLDRGLGSGGGDVSKSDSTVVFYTPTQALGKINWSDTTSTIATQAYVDANGGGELAWSDTVSTLATKSDLDGITGGSAEAGFGLTKSSDTLSVDTSQVSLVSINPSANKIAVWKSTDSLGYGGSAAIDTISGGVTVTGPVVATKVNGEGKWTYSIAGADSANSTRATQSQHTGLTVTLTANDTLEVEWKTYFTSAATATGLVLIPITSGSITSISGYSTVFGSANDGSDQQLTGSHTASADTVVFATTQVANKLLEAKSRFVIVTGASERTLGYYFKSEITGSAVTVRKGSYARIRKYNPQVW